MFTNTQKRILSAAVMMFICFISGYYGKYSTYLLVVIVGILMTDEIYINFFRLPRFNLKYFLAQSLYILPFIYINIVVNTIELNNIFNRICLIQNILLLIYLFFLPMQENCMEKIKNKIPFVVGIFTLLPMISLSRLLFYEKWVLIMLVLIVVNFGMDTGAWFFGKSFGRHKLWPKISPNKTIEGLVGGMLTSGVLGYFVWLSCFGKAEYLMILIFALLGLLSQLGDLVQSKLKRQFMIKDSSSLIPGHGGVYDRIDSLVFVLPFFVAVVNYYY